ncbi:thioredoxin family protein [Propionibacterium australiense]|uniref:Thioredoxin n=1 Tax=Propionibacterium australiense TaxID=119981 RepID=A0A383S351_9ACTN|nr:thioredoxin family protein [Propionibacterium australiense]RLP11676.1 thioredoxin [Propionibacterium australiense]RLP12189.1 thioredoxin [Propionibacterium australiense]SYZ32410.1 Thioredoxin domain [Propionibacterium australiense]VEH90270.1 thioredoxin [Propionibacterium australiense]
MKKIIGSLTAAVLAAGVLAACGPNDKKDADGSMSPAMSSDAMSPESAMSHDAMSPESAMSSGAMSQESAMSQDKMMSPGRFISHDEYKANSDKKTDTKSILFFNATWCPSCQAITKALKENPGRIPDGTDIVSVDYDSNPELRQKYGVTTQHTFVQVDAEGNAVRTWSATNIDDALSGIKN